VCQLLHQLSSSVGERPPAQATHDSNRMTRVPQFRTSTGGRTQLPCNSRVLGRRTQCLTGLRTERGWSRHGLGRCLRDERCRCCSAWVCAVWFSLGLPTLKCYHIRAGGRTRAGWLSRTPEQTYAHRPEIACGVGGSRRWVRTLVHRCSRACCTYPEWATI
jgi:hypothetical protein